MVNISQHKTAQKKDLEKTNIKLQLAKQIFSEEFSKLLHDFSKEHCEEPLKVFRQSWKSWIEISDMKIKIKLEIDRIMENNFVGTKDEIIKKIYTSARFYYRKKEKREKKIKNTETESENQKKPYIGFTKEFIQLIDNEIKNKILQTADSNNDNTKNQDIIKIDQKEAFHNFITSHISEINNELGQLKTKYDDYDEEFVAKNIAHKLKKAYQNRFYSICKILNNVK
jgi:hypothetical protein